MARKKESKKNTFGVADGFEFNPDISKLEEKLEEKTEEKEIKVSTKKTTIAAEGKIDPTRNYSKYYKPHPKVGSKGGTLGRGKIPSSERKIQFSVSCTAEQKARYMEAAKNDNRKLPDLVNRAIEEYIENHNL